MNMLVDYASDSDSDLDTTIACDAKPKNLSPTPLFSSGSETHVSGADVHSFMGTGTSSGSDGSFSSSSQPPQQTTQESPEEIFRVDTDSKTQQSSTQAEFAEENVFISLALQDLKDFAASVDPVNPAPHTLVRPPMPSSQAPQSDVVYPLPPQPAEETVGQQVLSSAMDMKMDVDHPDQEETSKGSPTQDITSIPRPALTVEQEKILALFLEEVDAIPFVATDPILRPPLPESIQAMVSISSTSLEMNQPIDQQVESEPDQAIRSEQWQRVESIPSIYRRMYHLSLLLSTTTSVSDPYQQRYKMLEDRLIEFAIRILDWEQGGLRADYFLGEERAAALASKKKVELERKKRRRHSTDHSTQDWMEEEDDTSSEGRMEEDEKSDGDDNEEGEEEEGKEDAEAESGQKDMLPAYGGVIQSMLQLMETTEQETAPTGWQLFWDHKNESYGFLHSTTGAISETLPTVAEPLTKLQ
ncbi:hypothetical protein BGW38_005208 [Lunasporangiospora selenospora]|uniref:Uncharacterized protein n=1 Tax=Lunasporangiospora selenospora TaxID=979761 RepID=A0A9P6G3Y2_9FUNG|nr:hypothetical protein BGW38_005208 [Lunasporangiospora selenospora]